MLTPERKKKKQPFTAKKKITFASIYKRLFHPQFNRSDFDNFTTYEIMRPNMK